MDRRGEDAGAIAWPGFVDILSAVIIMFVFFVMITSIVMFVISVNHKKMMEQESDRKLQEEIQEIKSQILTKNDMSPEEFEIQIEKISEMQNLNSQIEDMSQQIAQLRANLAEARDQSAVIDADNNEFIVLYQRNEMTITDDTSKRIVDFIESVRRTKGDDFEIILQAGDNPEAASISVARELSLARSFNVRNVLLQNNLEKRNIKIRYTKPENIEGTHHWVRIKIK